MNLNAVALAGIISAPNMMIMFFAIVVRTGIILGTLQISQRFVRNGRRMMENDYISRQALCQYALNQKEKSVTPNDIMRFPSADVVPVVHGKWIRGKYTDDDLRHNDYSYRCNRCGKIVDFEENYCPHCGAKMDIHGEV